MSIRTALITLSVLTCAACTAPDQQNDQEQSNQAAQGEQETATNLATFDALDFDVFSNQAWDRLHESHGKDIIVHWPDGHQTQGIDVHIEDLKAMFVYAPDMRIKEHPIKIGSGEWTSVVGVLEGTFTKPMPLPDGTSIPPTGKAIKMEMNTVGHWKDGVMTEEYLFWDNKLFLQQLGLEK